MLTQSARAQATKLVGQWLAGATNFNDISGYAPTNTHDGYLVGGADVVFTNDVPLGKTGQSLLFTLGDTGLAISNSSTYDANYVGDFDTNIANAFTVTCWARGYSGAWNPWVSKWGETPPDGGWQLRNDGSVNNGATWACWTVREGGVGAVSLGTAVYGDSEDLSADHTGGIQANDGNWHHYAGVFSTATGIRSLYIDGVLAAQATNETASVNLAVAEHLCIGAKDSYSATVIPDFGNYYSAGGEIYDVRIYNYGLTSNQVVGVMGTNLPPGITGLPKAENVIAATKIQIFPSVTGTTPFYYQWLLDGTNLVNSTNISGVTSNILTVSNMVTADVGSYQLVVTNAYGTNISSNLVVSIQYPLAAPKSGSYGAVLLTNSPLAFWQLNETNDPSTGALIAYDYTGHGYNGTYGKDAQDGLDGSLSPQPYGTPAYPGFATNQGALTTVANDANSVVTVPALNLSTNIVDTTICMWIEPFSEPSTFTGLFFNRTVDAAGLGFSGTQNATLGATSLGYTWNNTAGSYNWNSGLFPLSGVWSFVAVVVQSNQATMYLDYIDPNTGLDVLSSATNLNTQTAEAFAGISYIGTDPNNANRTFSGSISDVAVFHSALNSAAILHLFGEGLGVSGIAPSLTAQPPATYSFVGETAQISAAVAGTTPIYYQWQLDGSNLVNNSIFSGVNTNVLTISNVVASDQGSYSLIITNTFGNAISSNATLTIQSSNLVGEWLGGATNFNDISGYSPTNTHDGYLVGGADAVFTNDVPLGKTGQSLVFTVGDTGLAISNSSTLDTSYVNVYDNAIDGAFTVTCWARGVPGAWNPWVSKWGEGEGGWQLRQFNNSAFSAFTVRDNNAGGADLGGGGDDMESTFPSANNNWHLYAGVFNSVTGRRSLYVDGVLAADETNNVPYVLAAAEHLCVGAKDSPPGNTFGNYFVGEIFDVRVYNYALAQTQVVAILGNIPPAVNGQPPSITAYVGFTAQISATGIAGTPPLYYQWQFNGTNLPNIAAFSGINSNVLTLNNVTTNYAGSYSLVVTNAYGVTLSSNSVVIVATPYLIGNWLSGATNFNDSSGYAPTNTHDGYLVGSTNLTWTNDVPPGRSGYSALFGSSSTGLAISNSSTLDANYRNDYDDAIQGAFTVMTWAKGWPGSWNPWVSKWGESPPEAGWQLRTDGSGSTYACFTVRNGSVGTVTLGAAVYGNSDDMATRSIAIGSAQNGVWHHYAGVFDSVTGNRSLYIDGVLAAHETGNVADILAAAEHLCIAAKDSSPGNTFGNYSTMRLYDVRMYNYPLTQVQVQVAAELQPTLSDSPSSTVNGMTIAGDSSYGGQIVLTWPYGTLQTSTNLANPVWTRLTNTSPYTNIMTNQQMYFKLSIP